MELMGLYKTGSLEHELMTSELLENFNLQGCEWHNRGIHMSSLGYSNKEPFESSINLAARQD